MARANGRLEVHLVFDGLSKKAKTELQGKIAKLGAIKVNINEHPLTATASGASPKRIPTEQSSV